LKPHFDTITAAVRAAVARAFPKHPLLEDLQQEAVVAALERYRSSGLEGEDITRACIASGLNAARDLHRAEKRSREFQIPDTPGGEPTVRVNVRLPASIYHEAVEVARELGVSLSRFLAGCVAWFLRYRPC
jgi:hypothetical protein